MKIIVVKDGVKVDLEKALALGYAKVEGASIIPDGKFKICQSTNLLDINGEEIYTGDVIVDVYSRKRYIVFQYYASVFIKSLEEESACILDTITNYKLANKIDFFIEK